MDDACELCNREFDPYDGMTRLLDAVINGFPAKVCKRCSEMHNVILVSTPTEEQINNIHRSLVPKRKEEIQKEIALFDFGRTIKKARENAGLKRDEVAGIMQIPYETIKEIENGIIKDKVSLSKLKDFLRAKGQEKYINEQKKTQVALPPLPTPPTEPIQPVVNSNDNNNENKNEIQGSILDEIGIIDVEKIIHKPRTLISKKESTIGELCRIDKEQERKVMKKKTEEIAEKVQKVVDEYRK